MTRVTDTRTWSSHDWQLSSTSQLRMTGLVGLLGALIVTGSQILSQLPSHAWITKAEAYLIAAMAAPLCIVGYVHVFLAMRPAEAWQRLVVLISGGYAFALGAQWLGSRFYSELIADAFSYSSAPAEATIANLLVIVASENEPLLWAHEVGIAVSSTVLTLAVLRGRTLYPKWFAACSPITLLAAAMAVGSYIPVSGKYLAPAAMSGAHALFFGFATLSIKSRASARPTPQRI